MPSRIHFGYADTPLGQVHYREAGSGPPALFFHESPLSGATFEPALPLLGRHLHAIAPDTPGYGASEPPPAPTSITDYARRMIAFADKLGIGKFAAVGYHTGSAIGIQLAVDYPERVPALFVVGCPLFTEEELPKWKKWLTDYYHPVPDGSHLIDLWKRYRPLWGPDTPVEMVQFYVTEFLKGGPRYDWGFRAAFDFKAQELLPRIKCPTYFLITEGDDLAKKNEPAVALTPGAEGKIIPSPYGQLPEREPEMFASEVIAFLKRAGYL